MTNDRHFSVDVAYLADAASDVSKLLAWLKHLMWRRPAVTNDDTTPAGLIRRWERQDRHTGQSVTWRPTRDDAQSVRLKGANGSSWALTHRELRVQLCDAAAASAPARRCSYCEALSQPLRSQFAFNSLIIAAPLRAHFSRHQQRLNLQS